MCNINVKACWPVLASSVRDADEVTVCFFPFSGKFLVRAEEDTTFPWHYRSSLRFLLSRYVYSSYVGNIGKRSGTFGSVKLFCLIAASFFPFASIGPLRSVVGAAEA